MYSILRLLLLALLLSGTAQAEVAIPTLTQRVTDLTATLDSNQIQALDAKLAAFTASKGSQIAVLILPTTQPEAIEQFSIRVAEAWKIGRKGVDDGVILLVAKEDRKLRIEVGYGLEGALPDATAKRIVAEIISPYFKRGEFYAGIDAGVAAVINVVQGEPLPAPEPQSATDSMGPVETALLPSILIFIFGNIILRQFMGRLPSGLIIGGAIGGLAWLVLTSMLLAGVGAVIGFLLSLFFGLGGGGGSGSRSSGYSGWGGGSGGGWGSSSGGGDFGGGGGGFGGGGASGDW
jgi:uncharacterized protein